MTVLGVISTRVSREKGKKMWKNLQWNGETITDALDSVTFYNGLADDILKWKDLPIENGLIKCPLDIPHTEEEHQLQVFWMILVCIFGDYGTSPRFGWIDGDMKEQFDVFIDDITFARRGLLDEQ
jgi:hypothetical protein